MDEQEKINLAKFRAQEALDLTKDADTDPNGKLKKNVTLETFFQLRSALKDILEVLNG